MNYWFLSNLKILSEKADRGIVRRGEIISLRARKIVAGETFEGVSDNIKAVVNNSKEIFSEKAFSFKRIMRQFREAAGNVSFDIIGQRMSQILRKIVEYAK